MAAKDGSWPTLEWWLRAQVGVHEIGHSNRQIYAAMAGHPDGQEWCATFITAGIKQNGVPGVPKAALSPSSRTMHAEAVKAGLGVPMGKVQPGDVVHLWRGRTKADWKGHVEVVLQVLKDGRLVSVGGNTNAAGSSTGGSVLIHTYPPSHWTIGAWRPPYKPQAATQMWVLTDGPDAGAIVQPIPGGLPKLLDRAGVEKLKAKGWTFIPHGNVAFTR